MNCSLRFLLCLGMSAFLCLSCGNDEQPEEGNCEGASCQTQPGGNSDNGGNGDNGDNNENGNNENGNNENGDNGGNGDDNGHSDHDVGTPENTEDACHDGIDNDKNDLMDCADATCGATLWCQLYTTHDTGVPGVRVAHADSLVTSEDGKTAIFAIVLTSKPEDEVTVMAESSHEMEGITRSEAGGRGVVFDPSNWNIPQYFVIEGQDDTAKDGDVTYYIYFDVYSDSEAWDGLEVEDLTVINIDNETPSTPASFTLDKDALEVWETGIGASLMIRADTKPMSDVTIQVSVSDDSEISVTPSSITITPDEFREAKEIVVRGVSDHLKDGDQHATVRFHVTSQDDRFHGYAIDGVPVVIHDVDTETTGKVKLRMMAANTTSGNYQSYDGGEGARIFMAVKPDIAMIQEFKVNDGSLEDFVRQTFGAEFNYYQGSGNIPNGIVSRYPILETGSWNGTSLPDRKHEWARIDIPGDRELLVVSVHLHTDYELQNANMRELRDNVRAMLSTTNDYVVLGGDFNTSSRDRVKEILGGIFDTNAPYPQDQNGTEGTSFDRKRPLDWVLASHDLQALMTDTVIGGKSYSGGHVFDARVYAAKGTLSTVVPVEAGDSGPDASVTNNASGIQHMAVIRDFELSVE